ncbi:LuxR C-terminal-related transcriptional regulator [Leucobacter celer]|uniref:LuxR C-terminal-related transcriptional regulator n=1 Tax=Leucobacter celer TaxID=668625 RepID=UPI0006A7CC90|nr:LuxR C-terminal-related transcriptional regulator [Leucobacter celer]
MTQLTDASAQRTLDDAVAEFARATRFPLAFGGFESGGVSTITALAGHRTLSLQGLRVEHSRGLGGRAMSECRPRLTTDYARSRHITHDYDAEISTEGIVSLFAMPVMVGGAVRAVLYGGTRGGSVPGASFVHAAASVAGAFGQEIRVQDEVERRVTAAALDRARQSETPAPVLEALRSSHAELRSIAAEVADPALRERLSLLERRLAGIGGPANGEAALVDEPTVTLSRRETDVLAHAALGGTNAQIGAALGLTESTVKSYMQAAMSKLGVSTRHAAVSGARMRGLIL